MPGRIDPMLAVLSELPRDADRHQFEFKWDGVRAICYFDRRLSLRSRNHNDITKRYPELQPLASALGNHRAILDGEVVALDADRFPSFGRLQRRMHVLDTGAIARLVSEIPVCYILFDLLYLDGRLLLERPLQERRQRLEELALSGPSWQVSPAVRGEGKELLAVARQHGQEGVMAKRLDSIYEPGRRSPAWRKVKIVQRQELVIGGWRPQKGNVLSRVGALLMGYYGADATGKRRLHYAGSVGTGYSDVTHGTLVGLLKRHRRTDSPFADPLSSRDVIWVDPVLVAEVEYRRWPEGGMIQQAAFAGLRSDKDAREVVRERPIKG